MAEFELRNYVASAAYLEAALRSEVRPLDAEQRRQVEGLLGRAVGFTAILRLYVEPRAASVALDGAALSAEQLQEPIRLAAGRHRLEAKADGYDKAVRELELLSGREQALRLALDKSPSSDERPLRRNPWLWTGVGAVVVAGAVTGVLLALQGRDPGRVAPDGGSTNAVVVGPSNGDGR
jgi:hypothetical protein